METRKITVPETPKTLQELMTRDGPIEFTFAKFVTYLLNSCKAFSEDGAGLRAGVRIEDALESTEGCVIREDDWQRLKTCSVSPGVPYPCTPARAVVPYIDAIEDAVIVRDA
jgi:hypothetical protein